jgi:hypothetical protein
LYTTGALQQGFRQVRRPAMQRCDRSGDCGDIGALLCRFCVDIASNSVKFLRQPRSLRASRVVAGVSRHAARCGIISLSPTPVSWERAAMTASATPAHAVRHARCPRCGTAFDCGRNTDPFDCWCKALPAVPANQLDPRGRCMCPECLAAAVAAGGDPKGGAIR